MPGDLRGRRPAERGWSEFWRLGNGRHPVDRVCIVRQDDEEWHLQVGRCGLNGGGSIIRDDHFGLDEYVSEPTDGKESEQTLAGGVQVLGR